MYGTASIAPEAISEDLLYVVDRGARAVDVYTFPQLQRVRRIRGTSPMGDCSDRAGNVWIAGRDGSVAEYAHGGTEPIKSLHLGSDIVAMSCAVDPRTGNLAVTSDGPVYVFAHAHDPPKRYRQRWVSAGYCTYDDASNLYVAGSVREDKKFLAVVWALYRGERRLSRLRFHDRAQFADSGGVQWDGRDLAWGDLHDIASDAATIYQIDTRKRRDEFAGSTALILRGDLGQFFIRGHTIFVPYFTNPNGGALAIFNYPSGGERLATITGFRRPVAVTFSAAALRE